METRPVSSSRRTGAALALAAGILELIAFFFIPAYSAGWGHATIFSLTPFSILWGSVELEYYTGLCIFLIAIAVIGSLTCAGLSLLILINPDTPHIKGNAIGLSIGFGLALIPYIFLLSGSASTLISSVIDFFDVFAYLLSAVLVVAGIITMFKDPAPAASPVGPAAPYSPVLSDSSTDAVTGLDSAGGQRLILVRMNTQEHFRVLSTFPATILGRSGSDAGIVVSGNGLIGRQHAKIEYQDGQFCITDLNSKNKTYLNDICLQPNTRYAIRQGDYITLANEVFLVDTIDNC